MGLSGLTWRLAGRQTETGFIICLLHIYWCQIFLQIHILHLSLSFFLRGVILQWQPIDIQMRNLHYIFNMDIWMIIKSIEAKPAQSPLNNGWGVDVTQFVRYKTQTTPVSLLIATALSLFASIHLTWHHSIKSVHDKENNLGQQWKGGWVWMIVSPSHRCRPLRYTNQHFPSFSSGAEL